MPFVTRLTVQSGDRPLLDEVVGEIKARAARKGVELRGPNPEPLRELSVPQYRRLHPDGGRFETWAYTVYTRTISIIGHDDFARTVAGREYPQGVHLAADIEQVRASG